MTGNAYRTAWLVPLALALAACMGSDRGTEEVANRPSAAVDRADDFATRATELVGRHERLGRFSGAVAVSRGGKVLFAGGYGLADRELGTPKTTETRFDIASLTKQFTAAGILALEAEGKLSVNDRVVAHLPDYPRPAGEKITLHHLLSHRSGIPSLGRLGDELEAVERPPAPVELDDEALESWTGLYAIEKGGELRIDLADGALWVEPTLGSPTIFDYGQLEDPTTLGRAAEVAAIAIDAALAGNFDAVPLCPPLAGEATHEGRRLKHRSNG